MTVQDNQIELSITIRIPSDEEIHNELAEVLAARAKLAQHIDQLKTIRNALNDVKSSFQPKGNIHDT